MVTCMASGFPKRAMKLEDVSGRIVAGLVRSSSSTPSLRAKPTMYWSLS